MNPGAPDGRCEICQIEGLGACGWGAVTCPHADPPPKPVQGFNHLAVLGYGDGPNDRKLRPYIPPPRPTVHPDVSLAMTLSGSVVWTRDACRQLAELVDRNSKTGSPLGYNGYVTMRDLLWRVRELLEAQEAADRAIKELL